MITGFNTDVPHEGHVYHVQTEDGGSGNPFLESLIYVGGTIVAKKLTPYTEQMSEGADQEAIASLLRRQHQVIIAAIKAGRIQDLIRHTQKQQEALDSQEKGKTPEFYITQPERKADLSMRDCDAVTQPEHQAVVVSTQDPALVTHPERQADLFMQDPAFITQPERKADLSIQDTAFVTHPERKADLSIQDTAFVTHPERNPDLSKQDPAFVTQERQADLSTQNRAGDTAPVPVSPAVPIAKPIRPGKRISGGLKNSAPSLASVDSGSLNFDQVIADYLKRGSGQVRLELRVLAPEVFIAGSSIGLRIEVTHDSKPQFDATVTVKIIGTAFKPQVFIGRVGRDGVASFNLSLPSFTAGTAAIVIEAQSGTGRGELKNLIRRA